MADPQGISQRRSSLYEIKYETLYAWKNAIVPTRITLKMAFTVDARQKQEAAISRFEKVLKSLLEGTVKVGDPIYDISGNVLGAYVEDDPDNLRFFVEPFIEVQAEEKKGPVKVIDNFEMTHVSLTAEGFQVGGFIEEVRKL